jgi:hypothetical protein
VLELTDVVGTYSERLTRRQPRRRASASPIRHPRVLGVNKACGGEVGWIDPSIGDRHAARDADRLA